MSGTANNGMDELAILVESFVEEVKPFLAGIRRGVAGIFAMPRDSQAITSARGYLSTISASAQVLDLPSARQLGELAQLLDEAFQSAERGGVPDESRVPMAAMVDHLEEHLDGLLTGDDRGRERLDNVYRLLEQVLQTVEEAEAAPPPSLDISLDDLLLTLQPTATAGAAPQEAAAVVEEVVEPEKVETTDLVLLAEEEVAPIEWGEKEAKLWEKRGWDESQAAYGNTGWVFLDDDEEAAHAASRGEDTLLAAAPTAPVEPPAPEAEVVVAPDVATDEVLAASEPTGTASLADLVPEKVLPATEDTAEQVVTASLATADLAGFADDGSDRVLLPTLPVAAPEPASTASLAELAPEGTDKVLLPTVAAATGALSIDADSLEEAALLALTPDQLETYLSIDSSEQRAYLEARLGEMSDFAAELGLEATEHAGADEVTELIAALPSTGELLGKPTVPITAPLGTDADDEHEPLAPAKRRGRKSRRSVLPAAFANGETGSLSDTVLHVAPAGEAPELGQGEETTAPTDVAGDVASADDMLLTEYRSTDYGTGVLGTDALEAAGRVRVEPRDADRSDGTDRLLSTAAESDDAPPATAEAHDGEDAGSFLDELFEEDGAPGMSQAQVSSASTQFFDDEDDGEIDPAYSALPDVSPEIEAAFAQLSDADMATFLSLDGEAAMVFLQARASGQDTVVADAPASEIEADAAPQHVEVQAERAAVEDVALLEADLPDVAIDQEILEVFLLEMQELLAEWVRTAGQLRAMPANGALIADLRRVAHTVKGAARMVGFHDLGTVGWRVEELLDLLDERDLAAAPAILDYVDRSYALIERLSADTSLAASAYAGETAELDRMHAELSEAIKAGELVAPVAESARRPDAGEDRLVASGATGDGQEMGEDEEISDELLDVFVQEADEHLAAFNRALVALDRNPADTNQVNEAKRVVHTLKGASAALGYPVTAALCHSIEDLFEQLDSTGRQPSREMMTLFFESAETLEVLMAGITAGRGEDAAQAVPLRSRYAAFLKGDQGAATAQDRVVQQMAVAGAGDGQQRSGEGTVRSVRVDIAHLDNLLNLVGELVINRTSQEQHLERLGRTVNELLLSVDRLRRVGFQLESRYEVAELLRSEQRPTTGGNVGTGSSRLRLLSPQGGEEEEFDALEMDRYTELHRISRELVEIAADINAAGTELDSLYDNFDQTLSRQSRIATDLQDRMMEVRLVPISTLAARLYRAVRGVAQRRSRQVELVLEGETVEIDKVLLEEITDPLLHLVRNAADHGIESPHDRLVRGKVAGGTIRLSAAREGNEAVIRVSDDGAGIDLDRVLEKAIARGVVRNRSGMTREQILDLIFLPGFSTSASVSDISGRGVGLDVVRTNVRRLKGTIDVESTPGVGTTFTIRLPIMLAVTRALLIRSGAQTFAIPLPVVEQVAFFRKDQVSTVGGGDLFDLGGETYPVVYLSRALGLSDTSETLSSGARALIVGNIDRRIALVVDELVGQQEIVVKQLGRHLQSVAGVAGATILGNGQVVLILNVLDLIGDRRAVRPANGRVTEVVTPQPQPLRPIGAARGAEGPRVAMIVDDSLSVRRVLTRTLERDGWQVVGAKDGVEALEMLAWANPRVMVLDIEMPRMDGYELTSLIRNHPDYHDLPIAMLTSRAGEKHRRKAFDLGVSAYLVKPFEESDLLRTVRELGLTVRQARDAG